MLFTSFLLSVAMLAPSPHHKYGLTEAMPRIDGTIRVATYNVLNFFDHQNDPTLEGEYDDFGDNPGPTSFDRCEELAKVIRALDADVLALEEVESYEAIEWFNNTYLKGMGYNFIASEDVGYYRGVEQSLLSRFPITDVIVWKDADLTQVKREGIGWEPVPQEAIKELSFQRSPLCVTIETPSGYELTLYVIHHKAGRNKWHREAEALKIMEYIDAMSVENTDRNIVVLGDFNAKTFDQSFRTYLRGGMVDTMAHRSTNVDFDRDAPLWKTHTSNRTIDFVLLNPAAYGEFVLNSGFILGTSSEDYNWRSDPIPSGYASDHYPVSIDLVPREGQGVTAKAKSWPESATKTTLNITRVTAQPTDSSDTAISADGAPFLASKNSDKFHTAACRSVKTIKERNLIGFASIKDALRQGKKPAKCCNPK